MKQPSIAIVGGQSLLGRELREILADDPIGAELKLIGADEEEAGSITEQAGEPVVMTAMDADTLGAARVVLLAGTPESTAKALALSKEHGASPVFVDLTYALDDAPGSRLRAPSVEEEPLPCPPECTHVIGHPAAIVLAMVLPRLNAANPIRNAVANIFEPASERGRRGVNELQAQTVSLLSFKSPPTEVYDEQLSFNLLSRYGIDAPEPLSDIEHRIERHLATLLERANRTPMPSLRLIQAPVFHGYTISLWVEFEGVPTREAVEKSLAAKDIELRSEDLDAPTNAGIAGQSGLSIGAIQQDRNNRRAFWFWVVTDNLRLTAENAIAVAKSLLERDDVRPGR